MKVYGIKWHEGKQVSSGDLLKAVLEVDGNLCIQRFELLEIGKSFLDNVFERGSGPTGAGVEPTGHDLTMHQLNITIAQENVLWGLWREGVVCVCVLSSGYRG